jgi:hypothetical protein
MGDADSISGACYCGAVRFRVTFPTLFSAHCHCSICRRNHGAAFVTWFVVPREQFTLERGKDALLHFQSSEHGTRSFCGRCGSTLLCESSSDPDVVDVVLANMEAPIDRAPEAHVYFDNHASWVTVTDNLPRLGGPTGLEPLRGAKTPSS